MSPRTETLREQFAQNAACAYFKIYCPQEKMDLVLTQCLAPFFDDVKKRFELDNIFFLRYGDPEWHLRVRLMKVKNSLNRQSRADMKKLIEERLAQFGLKAEPHAYRPELSRYGGRLGVRLFEMVSSISSTAALKFIDAQPAASGISRLEVAIVSGECLLDGIGIKIPTRNRVMSEDIDLNDLSPLRESALFRQLAPRIRRAIKAPESYWKNRDKAMHSITSQFHEELRDLFSHWRQLSGDIGMPLVELGVSFLHLHNNRLGIHSPNEEVAMKLRGLAGSTR